MGKKDQHNDKDIVLPKGEHNDIDIVSRGDGEPRKEVLSKISEYKLDIIQSFMFGGPNKNFGDNRPFVNTAIKQVCQFAYVWMTELDEETRKLIIQYYLFPDDGGRAREYQDYLDSPVWKYIASIAKLCSNFTCGMCGKEFYPSYLHVHHHSYTHLGSELNYMDDISVLCKDCHQKLHEINKEGK